MKETDPKLEGIEVGNAWESRSPTIPDTNWIVGTFPSIPEDSLRFMQQSSPDGKITGAPATDIAIKWFVHSTVDNSMWGKSKPTSAGRTFSILVGEGEFELQFSKDDVVYTVTLDKPGDFAIWGPGFAHSWKPLKNSTILTVRWKPL